MAKHPRKRPRDPNQLAHMIVGIATGDVNDVPDDQVLKSAAAELGRRGGAKGGPARAAALTPERRSEIAKAAAKRRWAPAKDK